MLPLVLCAITVVWSVLTGTFLALCRMSARGDAALRQSCHALGQAPVADGESPTAQARNFHLQPCVRPVARRHGVATSRGGRGRAGSCAARS